MRRFLPVLGFVVAWVCLSLLTQPISPDRLVATGIGALLLVEVVLCLLGSGKDKYKPIRRFVVFAIYFMVYGLLLLAANAVFPSAKVQGISMASFIYALIWIYAYLPFRASRKTKAHS